jgi:hypothetical protein
VEWVEVHSGSRCRPCAGAGEGTRAANSFDGIDVMNYYQAVAKDFRQRGFPVLIGSSG